MLAEIREIPGFGEMAIPPPVFTEMGGEFTGYAKGDYLEARWPIRSWYRGPTGNVQGGLLVAMFDNVFGPFAFLLVRDFVVTLGLDVTYVRPLTASDREVGVRVEPVEVTRRFVFLRGEARNRDAKLVATCQTEMVVMGADSLLDDAAGGEASGRPAS